jgi:XTP/dITP diphosphohydrolase
LRPSRIVVASHNPDKVGEIEALLSVYAPEVSVVRGLKWPEVEETEPTLEGNALLKARAAVSSTGLAALADDTGLEVKALAGGPGVRTARFAGETATYDLNISLLLAKLKDVSDRSASFRTVAALVDPTGEYVVAEGTLLGVIAYSRRGVRGFGYDPVFEVRGRTLAEVPHHEKNDISHRALAVTSLVSLVWP